MCFPSSLPQVSNWIWVALQSAIISLGTVHTHRCHMYPQMLDELWVISKVLTSLVRQISKVGTIKHKIFKARESNVGNENLVCLLIDTRGSMLSRSVFICDHQDSHESVGYHAFCFRVRTEYSPMLTNNSVWVFSSMCTLGLRTYAYFSIL